MIASASYWELWLMLMRITLQPAAMSSSRALRERELGPMVAMILVFLKAASQVARGWERWLMSVREMCGRASWVQSTPRARR